VDRQPDSASGLTRAESDRAEKREPGNSVPRLRDAATLIVLDRSSGVHKVLIGRRHGNHVFMPGKFVFPGGRTEPADSRVPVTSGLHPLEEAKLGTLARLSPARARAIALSALRETYEEAGLLIGSREAFHTPATGWEGFCAHGVRPALDGLRLVARAVTPPGRVRRFDTRFFCIWRDRVALELPDGGPTQELEELVWLPVEDAMRADIPMITRTVLGDLQARLAADPALEPGGSVTFYAMRHKRMFRQLL